MPLSVSNNVFLQHALCLHLRLCVLACAYVYTCAYFCVFGVILLLALSLSPSLSYFPPFLCLVHSLTCSFYGALARCSLSLSLSLALSFSLSFFLSIFLSVSHSLSHTHTHTVAYKHTLCCSLSLDLFFSLCCTVYLFSLSL